MPNRAANVNQNALNNLPPEVKAQLEAEKPAHLADFPQWYSAVYRFVCRFIETYPDYARVENLIKYKGQYEAKFAEPVQQAPPRLN